jgi:hypothetical protein
MGEDGALATSALKRALGPDERLKRFARGLGIAERCANGAGRMDACERPIRYPLHSLGSVERKGQHLVDVLCADCAHHEPIESQRDARAFR